MVIKAIITKLLLVSAFTHNFIKIVKMKTRCVDFKCVWLRFINNLLVSAFEYFTLYKHPSLVIYF